MIVLYIIVCTISAGFFAGLETGLLSANRMLLQEKKRKGILYAKTAEYLLSKPERLLGTTLVGGNIANVTAAVLFTNFFKEAGLAHLTGWGILIMALVFLIFNDLVPKSFFRKFSNTIAVKLTPLLVLFNFIFLPLSVVLNLIIKGLLLITGQYISSREELKSKRDLRFLIHLTGIRAGLTQSDRRMIEDILDFREQTAREVMTPFHKLSVINVNQSIREAAYLSYKTNSRFIPVSEVRTDNVVGFLDTKELLWRSESTLREVMKKTAYYPETIRIPDLLLDMNKKDLKVVFLSDEYGGVAGMITPGQIVGDVVHYIPETGSREEEIKTIGPGHYLIQGSADLEDLSHEIGLSIRPGYNKSLGGLLCERMGVIPEEGRVYEEAGFVFKVVSRDRLHIKEIEVTRKKKP